MSRYSDLAPGLKICRILNGMWQVAGGHGRINPEMAIAEMVKYHNSGFKSWDLADIYGPAEDFIGELRRTLSRLKGEEELRNVQALTKWVPDPQRITRSIVQSSIEKSMRRMGVSCIDLLQFHWWDYNNPYYIDALKHLFDLRNVQEAPAWREHYFGDGVRHQTERRRSKTCGHEKRPALLEEG